MTGALIRAIVAVAAHRQPAGDADALFLDPEQYCPENRRFIRFFRKNNVIAAKIATTAGRAPEDI